MTAWKPVTAIVRRVTLMGISNVVSASARFVFVVPIDPCRTPPVNTGYTHNLKHDMEPLLSAGGVAVHCTVSVNSDAWPELNGRNVVSEACFMRPVNASMTFALVVGSMTGNSCQLPPFPITVSQSTFPLLSWDAH